MKIKIIWAAAGLCLGILISFLLMYGLGQFRGEEGRLEITGDVKAVTELKAWSQWEGKEQITSQEGAFDAVPLSATLKETTIQGKLEKIYFTARDGFTSAVEAKDADKCYLSYSKAQGWFVIAPKHPVSTNAKDLEKIVLVSAGGDSGVTFIQADEVKKQITLGQLLTGPVTSYPNFEGKATTKSGGIIYESEIYTRSSGFSLNQFAAVKETDYLQLTAKDGKEYFMQNSGHFLIDGTRINYIDAKGEKYEDIKVVSVYPKTVQKGTGAVK
jgi:hypothetical protein